MQELTSEPDHQQQAGQVEPVSRRQQQRLAANLARELAESDDRPRERDGTDQDADVDLHLVDRLLGLGREHGGGVDVAREAHQAGGQTDQAVHQRHQLRHLRHLHLLRREEADGAAEDERADDPRITGWRDARPEHRGQHGDGHADHAEQVAAARGLRVGQAAQAQDEQDRGADVGDGGEARGHDSLRRAAPRSERPLGGQRSARSAKRGGCMIVLTCGTSPACAA